MYGEEISSVITSSLISLNEQWDLDIFGNIVPSPEEDELQFDYFKVGDLYIQLQNFDTDQSDLIQFTVYQFQVYRYGFEEHNDYLTNKMAYTNPIDCLDAAMIFIDTNWDFIYNFYSEAMNDDLLSSGYSLSSYQVIPPKPNFYPPEPPSGNIRKIDWDKLIVKPHRHYKHLNFNDDELIIRPFDRR